MENEKFDFQNQSDVEIGKENAVESNEYSASTSETGAIESSICEETSNKEVGCQNFVINTNETEECKSVNTSSECEKANRVKTENKETEQCEEITNKPAEVNATAADTAAIDGFKDLNFVGETQTETANVLSKEASFSESEIANYEDIVPQIDKPIGVYVKYDSDGKVKEVNSDIFIENLEGWTKIDEGFGDRYAHAQNQYFENEYI